MPTYDPKLSAQEARTLSEIGTLLSPHIGWAATTDEQQAARRALAQVRVLLLTMRPRPACPIRNLRFHYLEPLWLIRCELQGGNFRMACNELENLIHYLDIRQVGILRNVIALLTPYVEGATRNVSI